MEILQADGILDDIDALPLCQTGTSGNTYGMYCTAADVACDTK